MNESFMPSSLAAAAGLVLLLGSSPARAEFCSGSIQLRPGDELEILFQFQEVPVTAAGAIDFIAIVAGSSTTGWSEGSNLSVELCDGELLLNQQVSGQEIFYSYQSAESLWTGGAIIDMAPFASGSACGKHIRRPNFVTPDETSLYEMPLPQIWSGTGLGPGNSTPGPQAAIVECRIRRPDGLFSSGFDGGSAGSCGPGR
jgi:hypothetical protein